MVDTFTGLSYGSKIYPLADYAINNFQLEFFWMTDISNVGGPYFGCLVDNVKITKFSDGSDGNYDYSSGTSMAAPHVAGLAALIWGYKPELDYSEVKDVILTTGDDLSSLDGKTTTGKRINARNALNFLSETKPPYAVAIDNYKDDVLVSGVNEADVVYEFPVEGSITRFMAIYNPDSADASVEIGPVRSARPYFARTASEHNAIYAHAGGSFAALQGIADNEYNIYDLDALMTENDSYFWRDIGGEAPYNLYTSIEKLDDFRQDVYLTEGTFAQPWDFSDTPYSMDDIGFDLNEVKVNYDNEDYNVKWVYDETDSVYYRQTYQDENYVDYEDAGGSQIATVNFAIQYATTDPSTEIDQDNGEALLCRQGKCAFGVWQKENLDSNVKFYLKDGGAEFQFKTGKLWINVTDESNDTVPPIITLLGDDSVELFVDDSYTEYGANATDNIDGNISGDIVIDDSDVNTSEVGEYIVTYNVLDSAGNSADEVMRTINVIAAPKTDQIITFDNPGDKVYGIAPFVLSASASSGLPVTFSVLSGSATWDGNSLTLTGAGDVTIEASQAGDDAYNPAPDVEQTFNVAKATPTITWANPSDITEGTALSSTQLNAAASETGSFVYSPAAGIVLGVGSGQTLSVEFTPTDTTNYNNVFATATINVIAALNSDKEITSFNFTGIGLGVINEIDYTIAVAVPYSTDVTALTPTISITGSSVNPESGVAQNFTNPATYTVTAEDTTTQDYVVTVTADLNSAKAITSFDFTEGSGAINEANYTIAVAVPYGTDVTALTPTIVIIGDSVNPASGVAQNFTNPATYTVTAEDTTTQDYVVTVAVGEAPDTTPPVITLLGENSITIEVGSVYNDNGATAVDDVDGDLTSSIVVENNVDSNMVGSYTVTYNVSDSSGNPATEVIRIINVVDIEVPVIILLGDSPASVEAGYGYDDAGATANDNYDGDITSSIVTVNNVDSNIEGSYTVIYNVTDSSGNPADEVVRIVNVTPDMTPPICSNGSPSGALTSGTTQTTIQLSTDEDAICRYSTQANLSFASSTDIFSTTGSSTHSTVVSGLSNGNSYKYYIRCQDTQDNTNEDDFIISFSVAQPASSGGGGGGGSYTAPDTIPPAQPTDFSATRASSTIVLTWDNPNDSDFSGVILVRNITEISATVSGKNLKNFGDLIYDGKDEAYTNENIDENIVYYYAITAYDNKQNYSKPIIIKATLENEETVIAEEEVIVLGIEHTDYSSLKSLAGVAGNIVNMVSLDEADKIYDHNEFVNMDEVHFGIYNRIVGDYLDIINEETKYSIAHYIQFGTQTTLGLGAGERAGALNSYKAAFGEFPQSIEEWQDVIKIANGRWPTGQNEQAELRAKEKFKLIYLREPDMGNPHDNAAVTVIAYGLRPANRNMDSEKAAIKIFKGIFNYNPVGAVDWDMARAIAYSGAVR